MKSKILLVFLCFLTFCACRSVKKDKVYTEEIITSNNTISSDSAFRNIFSVVELNDSSSTKIEIVEETYDTSVTDSSTGQHPIKSRRTISATKTTGKNVVEEKRDTTSHYKTSENTEKQTKKTNNSTKTEKTHFLHNTYILIALLILLLVLGYIFFGKRFGIIKKCLTFASHCFHNVVFKLW